MLLLLCVFHSLTKNFQRCYVAIVKRWWRCCCCKRERDGYRYTEKKEYYLNVKQRKQAHDAKEWKWRKKKETRFKLKAIHEQMEFWVLFIFAAFSLAKALVTHFICFCLNTKCKNYGEYWRDDKITGTQRTTNVVLSEWTNRKREEKSDKRNAFDMVD